MKLLFILFLFISCGKTIQLDDFIQNDDVYERDRLHNTSDPIFKEYTDEIERMHYEITGEEISIDYPINFDNTKDRSKSGKAIGICFTPNNEVIIDKAHWERSSTHFCDRLALILHEVGHCTYGRGHKSNILKYFNKEVPLSVMNPVVLEGRGFCANQMEYMREMLTNDHSSLVNSILGYFEKEHRHGI